MAFPCCYHVSFPSPPLLPAPLHRKSENWGLRDRSSSAVFLGARRVAVTRPRESVTSTTIPFSRLDSRKKRD